MESLNLTVFMTLPFCDQNYISCVVLYIFLASLTAVTICGNLLVIISVIYFKQLHTPTNYLILSLAVADLLLGVLIFPFNMTFSLTSCLRYSTLNCKIRGSFDFLLSVSSILNLCCISIDRYYAVCQPLLYKSKITDNVALMMSLGSWVFSVLAAAFFLRMAFYFDVCGTECMPVLIGVCIFTYYLPIIGLIFLYLKIFVVAQRQARSIQNTVNQMGTAANKMERKATKTIALIVGLFLLCWLPLFITYPFQGISNIVSHMIEPFNWFALSNSMFNPFIYAFFYRWFRTAFRLIISGKIFQGDFANTKLH